jgi:hypothetical protein
MQNDVEFARFIRRREELNRRLDETRAQLAVSTNEETRI